MEGPLNILDAMEGEKYANIETRLCMNGKRCESSNSDNFNKNTKFLNNFSSPEHNVLKVNYCDHYVSIIHRP